VNSAAVRMGLQWVIAVATAIGGFGGFARAQDPEFVVSMSALQAVPFVSPPAKEMAALLNAEGWCKARPGETAAKWNEPPTGTTGANWVNIVTTAFNEQGDAYAFVFNGPGGAMSLAAHVPFRKVWTPAGVMAWVWPADAVAGALRVAVQEGALNQGRHPLALRVIPWDSGTAEASPAAPAAGANLGDARSVDPKLVFGPAAVIVNAAAFEAGWAPTPGQSPWAAVCEVRVEDQACSFRLKLQGPDGESTFVKEHVPWEAYHEHLVRLFRFVDGRSGISDFTQLARGPVDPLALRDNRLAALTNQELSVFDFQTGKRTWTTEPTTKPKGYRPMDQFAALDSGDGKARLMRYAGELAEFEWETGKRTTLLPGGADAATRIDVDGANTVAAAGGLVKLGRDRVAVWEKKSSSPVTAGPSIIGDAVVFGDTAGRLTSLSINDGAVRWTSELGGRLFGKIITARLRLYVHSTEAEALIALDGPTGKEKWRCATGDVLVQQPIPVGDQLLVATKGNRLMLVDDATGEVKRESRWPTWITSVTLVGSGPAPLVACSDIGGTISLVSLADFKSKREVRLAAPLSGRILYVKNFGPRWPVPRTGKEESLVAEIKDGPAAGGPALLVGDTAGFLYIIPLGKTE
jgi:outer membrane protein assembly factor BamB